MISGVRSKSSRRGNAFAIATLASLLAAACSHRPDDDDPGEEVEQRSSALQAPAFVTLDPAGYRGQICISGNIGCVTGAAPKIFSVGVGTFTITAPGTISLVAGAPDQTLGTMTVAADGTVAVAAPASFPAGHFTVTSVLTGTNAAVTLAAKVAPISINRNGYAGNIGLDTVVTDFGDGNQTNLIKGRKYRVSTAPLVDSARADAFFSATADLAVDANGLLAADTSLLGSFALDATSTVLNLNVTNVNIDRSTLSGALQITNLPVAVAPSAGPLLAVLLNGRSYPVSPATAPLAVAANGSCTATSLTASGVNLAVTCGATVPKSGAAVAIDFDGYPGSICFGSLGCFRRSAPPLAVPPGNYDITSPYAFRLGSDVASIGTLTNTGGTVSINSTYFQATATGFKVVTTPVRYQPNGTLLPLQLDDMHSLAGAEVATGGLLRNNVGPLVRLLKRRRYTLITNSGSVNLNGSLSDPVFAVLDVQSDGSVAINGGNGTSGPSQFLTMSGSPIFSAVVVQMHIPSTSSSRMCMLVNNGWYCGLPGAALDVAAIPGRRYAIYPGTGAVDVSVSGQCTGLGGVTVTCTAPVATCPVGAGLNALCAGDVCSPSRCDANGICQTFPASTPGTPCSGNDKCQKSGFCGISTFPVMGPMKCLTGAPIPLATPGQCSTDTCDSLVGPSPPPATCAQPGTTTRIAVDFDGYPGKVCFTSTLCLQRSGKTEIDLPNGITYSITSPNAAKLGADTAAIGTLIVASNGQYTLTSTHFEQPSTGVLKLLTAKVSYEANGTPVPLQIESIHTFLGPESWPNDLPFKENGDSARLMTNRAYSISSSGGAVELNTKSGWGLAALNVDANGRVTVTGTNAAAQFATSSTDSSVFSPLVTTLHVPNPNTTAILRMGTWHYGIPGATLDVQVPRGRRYVVGGVSGFDTNIDVDGTGNCTTSAVTGTQKLSGITCTPVAPLATPTGLAANVVSNSNVSLTWTASAGATAHVVQRADGNGGFAPVAGCNPAAVAGACSDNAAQLGGTKYQYRVVASSGAIRSYSNEATVNLSHPASGLTLTALSGSSIKIDWTDNTGGTKPFVLERSLVPGPTYQWGPGINIPAGVHTFTDTAGLVPLTTYFYHVGATPTGSLAIDFTDGLGATTLGPCLGAAAAAGDRCGGTLCNPMVCRASGSLGALECIQGAPVTCVTPESSCVFNVCNEATGGCVAGSAKMVGTACSDQSLCTTGDFCQNDPMLGPACAGGTAKNCNDGNACTTDTCTAALGCSNVVNPAIDPTTCGLTIPSACLMTDSVGGKVAVFGYVGTTTTVQVPHGPKNQIDPIALDGPQPQFFETGTHLAAFSIPTGGVPLSWTLGTQTVRATDDCVGAQKTAADDKLLMDPALLTSAVEQTEPLGGNLTIGGMPAELSVTNRGTASYQIPLDAPEGRKGIEPNLSLSYDSGSSQNGLLGVGWSLSGLSGVHRCPKTAAQDGVAEPVRFKPTDAFCLDGERLVPTGAAGPNGGVEYRTQNDSFSRIIAYGTHASGPVYFTVETAGGETLTYGMPDSAFPDIYAYQAEFQVVPTSDQPDLPIYFSGVPPSTAPQSAVIVDWPVTERKDRFGNRLTVSYTTFNGKTILGTAKPAFSRRPERIDYNYPVGSTLSPKRSVRFIYTSRSSTIAADPLLVAYQGGVKTVVDQLLTRIEMWAPNPKDPALVRYYKVTYNEGPVTHRSRLATIAECDAGDICKPTKTLNYTDGDADYETIPNSGPSFSQLDISSIAALQFGPDPLLTGDVNGDGRDDLVFGRKYMLSNGRGFDPPATITIDEVNVGGPSSTRVQGLVDLDGDGVAELRLVRLLGSHSYFEHCRLTPVPKSGAPGATTCVPLASPAVESPNPPDNTLPPPEHQIYTYADLNGDGYADILHTRLETLTDPQGSNHTSTKLKMRLNRSSTVAYSTLGSDPLAATASFIPTELDFDSGQFLDSIVDIDGDGRDEVLFLGPGTERKLFAWRLGATVTSTPTNIRKGSTLLKIPQRWFLDTNGDGLTDMVAIEPKDDNNDGQQDSIGVLPGHNWKVTRQINSGVGFLPPDLVMDNIDNPNAPSTAAFDNPPSNRDDSGVRIADWDGDGVQDMLLVDDNDNPPSSGHLGLPNAKRTNVRVIRFKANGEFDTTVTTNVPVGIHTNGVAGTGCPCLYWTLDIPPSDYLCSCSTSDATAQAKPFSFRWSQTLDANGDGLADIVNVGADGAVVLHLKKGDKPDLLQSVVEGEGPGSASITYRHVADNSPTAPTGEEKLYGDPCKNPSPPVRPDDPEHPGQGGAAIEDPLGGVLDRDATKDFYCVRSGMWVVADVKRDNGLGATNWLTTSYSYRDGRFSRGGDGFMGFRTKTERTKRPTVETTRTSYYSSFTSRTTQSNRTVYPYQGFAGQEETKIRGMASGVETALHSTSVTTQLPVFSSTAGDRYELAPSAEMVTLRQETLGGTTRVLANIKDEVVPSVLGFGRIESRTHTVSGSGGILQKDTTTYSDFMADKVASTDAHWIIGPATTVVHESQGPGEASPNAEKTRHTKFTFDPVTLFLKTTTREPDGTDDEKLVTTYTEKTDTGLIASVSTTGGGRTRSETYSYDPLEATYRQSSTNSLYQTTLAVYHPGIDKVAAVRSPNGALTKYIYDRFGRVKKKDLPPQMGDVTITLSKAPAGITTTVEGGTTTTTTFDSLDRPTTTKTSFSAHPIVPTPGMPDLQAQGVTDSYSQVSYDEVGRISTQTPPHALNENIPITTFAYDELGRITSVRRSDENGATTDLVRKVYEGAVTKTYDAKNNLTTTTKDARGFVVSAVDLYLEEQKDVTSEFVYEAFGRLHQIKALKQAGASPSITTTFDYDRIGRLHVLTDSNRGTRTTTFNAFDQPSTFEDGDHALTTFAYDDLGRTLSRIAAEGTSSWTYDTAPGGVGQVDIATSADLVKDVHTYDEIGRLQTRTRTIAVSDLPFKFDYAYDTMGRLDTVMYPETNGWARFGIKNVYQDGTGELSHVKRADTGALLWEAKAIDGAGRIRDELIGGTLETTTTISDLTGLLTKIEATSAGAALESFTYGYNVNDQVDWRQHTGRAGESTTYESYDYDSLKRLKSWTASDASKAPQPNTWEVNYIYSELGNLTSRTTNVGGANRQTATFAYNDSRPSAISSWTFPGVGTQAFTYDGSGRVKTHPRLGTITYNSYDLPLHMAGGTVTADFLYDTTGGRAYKREGNAVTLYAGGLYEVRFPGDGSLEHVLTIPAGAKTGGQISRTKSIAGVLSEQTAYFVRDLLGSPSSVVTTTPQGVQFTRESLDPFGNLMADVSAPVLDTSPLVSSAGRDHVRLGFTGHESDDLLGVVNMGGRIYEPLAGRFLTPDPFASAQKASQAWSAYSYVGNDPIGFVDPSGYRPEPIKDTRPPNGERSRCGGPLNRCSAPAAPEPRYRSEWEKWWDSVGGYPKPSKRDEESPLMKDWCDDQCHQANDLDSFMHDTSDDKEGVGDDPDSADKPDPAGAPPATDDQEQTSAEEEWLQAEADLADELETEKVGAVANGTNASNGLEYAAGGAAGGLVTLGEGIIAIPFLPEILIIGAAAGTAYLLFEGASAVVQWMNDSTKGPTVLESVNKVGPHDDAEGNHSTPKRDASGKVTGYTEFDATGNPVKRFRGEGKPHGGKEPPFILEPKAGKGPGAPPKVPRTPRPDELPKGY
jgi:RHS repeat-associated protein